MNKCNYNIRVEQRQYIELDDKPLKVVSRAEDWMTAWNQIWHW